MLPMCEAATCGTWRHHHRFGGTYPCSYPEPCSGCYGPEFREPPVLPANPQDED